jgi:hypothetical protein
MLLLLLVVLLLAYLLPTMHSPQNSRPENWPVLDSGEEGLSRQESVATKEDLQQRRLGDTGQPILPTPIAFPHTPTTFHTYSSNNQPISSNHRPLQAQIDLQRKKIRELELAVEERRRTEQLRMQEQRLSKRREIERKQELHRQRDEQRRIDRQARDESAMRAHYAIRLLLTRGRHRMQSAAG